MNRSIFYFVLFVFLLFSINGVMAQESPVPLVRFWGVIENTEGESPNCNLINNMRIFRDDEDLTYLSAIGFHNSDCYYSIDVELSKLNSGDGLVIKIDGITSENEIIYNGDSIINSNTIVELPDEYYSFIEGCMDESALNFDESANVNQGCEYHEEPEEEQEDPIVYGCVEESAINYNPYATNNDGSCIFEEEEQEDDIDTTYDDTSTNTEYENSREEIRPSSTPRRTTRDNIETITSDRTSNRDIVLEFEEQKEEESNQEESLDGENLLAESNMKQDTNTVDKEPIIEITENIMPITISLLVIANLAVFGLVVKVISKKRK